MNQGDMFSGKADAEKRALEMLKDMGRENLQLQTEFADKYKEIVLGETAFKRAQIEAQADAYLKAGSDEVAVAQWAAAEKLKYSRDWSDGAARAFQAYTENAGNAAQLAQNVIAGSFRGMEDALVEFVTTGKMNFSDFADSVIKDLARIAIQQAITGLIGALVGGMAGGGVSAAAGMAGTMSSFMSRSAKGNVFESAGLHAYANTVVDKPTVFPFARGVGLMGEAGPEAIMPLKRGPDGSLGVRGGGGNNIIINQIEAPGRGGEVQQREENGVSIIDMFVEKIENKVAGSISQGRGPVPSALARTYGLNRSSGALR